VLLLIVTDDTHFIGGQYTEAHTGDIQYPFCYYKSNREEEIGGRKQWNTNNDSSPYAAKNIETRLLRHHGQYYGYDFLTIGECPKQYIVQEMLPLLPGQQVIV